MFSESEQRFVADILTATNSSGDSAQPRPSSGKSDQTPKQSMDPWLCLNVAAGNKNELPQVHAGWWQVTCLFSKPLHPTTTVVDPVFSFQTTTDSAKQWLVPRLSERKRRHQCRPNTSDARRERFSACSSTALIKFRRSHEPQSPSVAVDGCLGRQVR